MQRQAAQVKLTFIFLCLFFFALLIFKSAALGFDGRMTIEYI